MNGADDRSEVCVDHWAATLAVCLANRTLDRRNRVIKRHQVGERKERHLHDDVHLATESHITRQPMRVDDMHIEAVDDDLFLHLTR